MKGFKSGDGAAWLSNHEPIISAAIAWLILRLHKGGTGMLKIGKALGIGQTARACRRGDRIGAPAAKLAGSSVRARSSLDPNNVTYHALLNRLLEIVLANITLANMFALFGVIFFVATLLMQTMVPLRVANMAGCAFFATAGALSGNVANFLLYLLLLPINAVRLRQMLKLVKKARNATQGDMSKE